MNDEDMKPENDFTKAIRGKHFIGPDAVIYLPVYLDREVQTFPMERAAIHGIALDHLVNEVLKRDIEAFKSLAGGSV